VYIGYLETISWRYPSSMRYKIKKNEKISDIVDKLDIPYDMIRRFNPFVESKEEVYEGRVLTLPVPFSVLPDQTYESISLSYSILPSYLYELNPYIEGRNIIYPGQSLFLPPIEY
jgi:LysM repeat protein